MLDKITRGNIKYLSYILILSISWFGLLVYSLAVSCRYIVNFSHFSPSLTLSSPLLPPYLFILVRWQFHPMSASHSQPPSLSSFQIHPSSFPTQLCSSYTQLPRPHQGQYLLLNYSWMCGLPLDRNWVTRPASFEKMIPPFPAPNNCQQLLLLFFF